MVIESYLLRPHNSAQSIFTTISTLRSNRKASKKASQHQSASLVDGESPGVPRVGLGRLNECDRASGSVDAVSCEGVLLRAESLVVADGSVEEVAGDAHLGGLGGLAAGRGCLARSEDGQSLGLAEGHAAAGRVLNGPGRDGVAEFVHGVKHLPFGRAGCRRPPSTVARTITGTCLGGRTGGELAAGGVDAEDTEEVGTKVRREEELASGILEDGVRVGSILAGGDRSGLGHGELLLLQDLRAGRQRQLVGRDGGRVAVKFVRLGGAHHLTVSSYYSAMATKLVPFTPPYNEPWTSPPVDLAWPLDLMLPSALTAKEATTLPPPHDPVSSKQ
jgi:hypothetical protein